MSRISFSNETIKIVGKGEVDGSYTIEVLDKLCRTHKVKWCYYEIAAVISMIIAEGGFKSSVDDYLFHIATNAVKKCQGLVLF